MRKTKRFLTVLLTAGMVMAMPCMTAMADGTDTASSTTLPYNYKITVYAGNKGTIGGDAVRTVEVDSTGAKLTYGSYVTLSDILSEVEVTDEKYYVRGIRLAGHDNAESGNELQTAVEAPGFTVEGDTDFVIAYGVTGEMVSYTVNYVDESGNALLSSDTFYGNVGDKPVVAYKYVEGYTPDALAATKTLVNDASENVFTFTYSPGEMAAPTVVTTTTIQTAGTAGGTTGTTAGTTDAGTTTDEGETDEDLTDVPEEDTPAALNDLDEIEDEDTPAANTDLSDGSSAASKGLPLAGSIGIAVAAAAVLVGIIIAVAKKKKSS